tara:strand:- start:253 stop:1008 length:756 start_codon:yes stop_codon:yes gene_type:complete
MKRIDFDSKVPFTEHLVELRNRLVVVVSTVMALSAVGFILRGSLINFLESPLPEAYRKMSFLSPTEGFFVAMKVSIFAGILFSIPVILFQSWAFVAPGLKEKERKYTVPLVFLGTLFFLFGVSFAYFAILPIGLNFLLSFGAQYWTPNITIGNYLSFCIKLLLAFGAVFEMPLLIAFACKVGLITTDQLIFYRKYAFLSFFVLGAMLTPPDVITQVFMALPLILLYEVGIYAGKFFEKKEEVETSERESEA